MKERALGQHAVKRERPAVEPGRRFHAFGPGIIGDWYIVDAASGLCWRNAAGRIQRFTSQALAAAKAQQLNTARVVCVQCRHKTLASECVGRVCSQCQTKSPTKEPTNTSWISPTS